MLSSGAINVGGGAMKRQIIMSSLRRIASNGY